MRYTACKTSVISRYSINSICPNYLLPRIPIVVCTHSQSTIASPEIYSLISPSIPNSQVLYLCGVEKKKQGGRTGAGLDKTTLLHRLATRAEHRVSGLHDVAMDCVITCYTKAKQEYCKERKRERKRKEEEKQPCNRTQRRGCEKKKRKRPNSQVTQDE
ncbi:hypothetical protein BD289DRAFT_233769 [Coniella lustricola]|uniref:Uncharacterized protein n=1 Tax=Coniella lustricola TaxID=2025994 RepID=A0A2T3AA13_9PEZI|nr:hypothetical protein BD289DRAFT_233769 [Coniella lustricola]